MSLTLSGISESTAPTADDRMMTDPYNPDSSTRMPEPAHQRRWLTVVALIGAMLAGFGGGYGLSAYRATQEPDPIVRQVINRDDTTARAVDFSLFWQVWDRLHERYVDSESLDAQRLVYGAINGMVGAAGDPYTVFLEPSDAEKFAEEVSGTFSGVGMELGIRNGTITVVSPIRDSPAMRAGIRTGDRIVSVDGESTDGWTTEEAVARIRGDRGTTVTLTVGRDGETDLLEVPIVRDVIRIPAVEWRMLDGNVAYIEVLTFNGNMEDEFAHAAQEALSAGATSIVLDLRDNPGGLLDASVTLAGWMLERGSVVVSEKFADGSTEPLRADGNEKFAHLPIVVLINGGSASASEIVAGALRDIRNVHLVGEQTFGKGSVQQMESFYNGSSLKVTVAKWLTPSGTSIADEGIAPTDPVAWDADRAEAEGWEARAPGKDPQLDRALELIRTP